MISLSLAAVFKVAFLLLAIVAVVDQPVSTSPATASANASHEQQHNQQADPT